MSDKLRSQGVKGVPMTVIDGKWAVNGSQASEVFVQVCLPAFGLVELGLTIIPICFFLLG